MEHVSVLTIADIPQEILLNIFKFLPLKDLVCNIKDVCILWKNLSIQKSLWKHFVIDRDLQNNLTTEDLISLIPPVQDYIEKIIFSKISGNFLQDIFFNHSQVFHLTNIKSVHLICPSDIEGLNEFVSEFIVRYSGVEEVIFESIPAPLETLNVTALLSLLPNLKKIHLQEVSIFHEERTWNPLDIDLFADFRFPLHLESIVLEEGLCYRITDDYVNMILHHCPHLRTLVLNDTFISSAAFEGISSPTKIVNLGIDRTLLDDNGLKLVTRIMPDLKVLSMESCQFITDVGLGHITEFCPGLESIVLSRDNESREGSNITSGGLQKLSQDCTSLRYITMSHSLLVNDTGLVTIATQCRNLSLIDIYGCTSVTDVSIVAIAENCQFLQEVIITECVHVTSTGINALLLKCRLMTKLHASTCHFISEIALDAFEVMESKVNQYFVGVQECICMLPSQTVMMLNIKGENSTKSNLVDDITSADLNNTCEYCLISDGKKNFLNSLMDPSLPKFSQCSSIQDLNLDFCSRLEDSSMWQLGKHCPNLRKLSLNGCFSITDVGIEYIAKHCQFLTHLEVANVSTLKNSRLTDSVMTMLADFAKHLEILNIEKVSSITCTGLKVKHLEILNIEKVSSITCTGLKDLLVRCLSLQKVYVSCGPDNAMSVSMLQGITTELGKRLARLAVRQDRRANENVVIYVQDTH